MAAPSLTDGIRRTIEELAIPSVVLLGIVIVLRTTYGPQEAGFAYLALSALPLLGIYTSARYWNSWYAFGFVVVGFVFWAGLPSVGQYFVPSAFVQASRVLELLFLLGVGWMLKSKVDWL
ncbi:hypothetical protein [Halopelagius longus]|uniref:DUF8216 domain-containing protein n=1 Tax=Halopelagius longus TaxID=1236180 RepID=A0A1H0Z991_9EURY|nr:hypothetical protein [Halopelagius longus]RDI72883.1 hypothetical protein DWB78_14765 [Halopelagius longus]SDQ23731.1 hypothetical protein SAMN05216278_1078 [Halopelagius longus]